MARKRNLSPGTRRAARLAAVQALYQMEIAGVTAAAAIDDFGHLPAEAAGGASERSSVDREFFTRLVRGSELKAEEVDRRVTGALSAEWPIQRLDSVVRAILRAGAWELMARVDVPARVVLDEYVDLAHAFFDGDKPSFINGVLDKLARELRPAEFSSPSHGGEQGRMK
jgi:N utilization substance protein B